MHLLILHLVRDMQSHCRVTGDGEISWCQRLPHIVTAEQQRGVGNLSGHGGQVPGAARGHVPAAVRWRWTHNCMSYGAQRAAAFLIVLALFGAGRFQTRHRNVRTVPRLVAGGRQNRESRARLGTQQHQQLEPGPEWLGCTAVRRKNCSRSRSVRAHMLNVDYW